MPFLTYNHIFTTLFAIKTAIPGLQQSNQHINHHHSLNISSTKHHFQFSPGSYDLMTGCPLEWKCFVPCLLIDWSQHPTWPQLKHRRRCTHVDPICKHSSQPSGVLALTFLITWSKWTQDGPLSFWFMCIFIHVHSFMLSVESNSVRQRRT